MHIIGGDRKKQITLEPEENEAILGAITDVIHSRLDKVDREKFTGDKEYVIGLCEECLFTMMAVQNLMTRVDPTKLKPAVEAAVEAYLLGTKQAADLGAASAG